MARHRPPAVGLDFGTTTSLVAQRKGAGPLELLPIGTTQRWLPSLVGRQSSSAVLNLEPKFSTRTAATWLSRCAYCWRIDGKTSLPMKIRLTQPWSTRARRNRKSVSLAGPDLR